MSNEVSSTTTNSELQIFKFEDVNDVRIVMRDGEPWFVAKDVCDILELNNITEALRNIDDDELASVLMKLGKQDRNMKIISESGLYSLILRSRKPEAKRFKRWVTHEVIPSIRKHGAYMTPETIEKVLFNPDFIINLATQIKEEKEKNRLLTLEIENKKEIITEQTNKITQDAPNVQFAQVVSMAKTDISIGALANLLSQQGIPIGQNRLFNEIKRNSPSSKRSERWGWIACCRQAIIYLFLSFVSCKLILRANIISMRK